MLLQDVQSPGSAALQGLGSGQPLPAARVASSFDDLRPAEAQRVESGAWFSGLSLTLRQAVLSRSRVHRVRRGATLLKRGSVATDWIGVAGGALGLATQGRDGRGFTLDWFLGSANNFNSVKWWHRGKYSTIFNQWAHIAR